MTSERLGREGLAAWEDRKSNADPEVAAEAKDDDQSPVEDDEAAKTEPEGAVGSETVTDEEAQTQRGTIPNMTEKMFVQKCREYPCDCIVLDVFKKGMLYKGIFLPSLTNSFHNKQLETSYLLYSNRQRQKSLIMLNIVDLGLKVSNANGRKNSRQFYSYQGRGET